MEPKDQKSEEELAKEFEKLEVSSRGKAIPCAPPGEFGKIIAEMKRRGIKPKIREEIKKKT